MCRKMVTYWVCTSAIHDPKSCTDSTAAAAWLYIALIPICWHSLCSRVMRRQPPAALLSWMMLHRPLWLVKHTIPDTITINIRSPAQGNSRMPLHQGLSAVAPLTTTAAYIPAGHQVQGGYATCRGQTQGCHWKVTLSPSSVYLPSLFHRLPTNAKTLKHVRFRKLHANSFASGTHHYVELHDLSCG